jgi:hypothetical protein
MRCRGLDSRQGYGIRAGIAFTPSFGLKLPQTRHQEG